MPLSWQMNTQNMVHANKECYSAIIKGQSPNTLSNVDGSQKHYMKKRN